MPRLNLTIKYKKNAGSVLSPSELISIFLYGIRIQSNTGEKFSPESLRFYIEAAQREIENFFNLRFKKQLIERETSSYYRDDYWQQFPFIKTQYPVRDALSLVGMLNKVEQIIYPIGWLRSEKNQYHINKRRISVVPSGASTTQANAEVILTGITSQIGFQRFENIPDYWDYQYITGFDIDNMPMDLLNMVGKTASFGPLGIAGDMILRSPGVANQSLSIDGLSQSIGTTASATNAGYGARILQYEKEIKESTKRLKLIYDEIKFTVL